MSAQNRLKDTREKQSKLPNKVQIIKNKNKKNQTSPSKYTTLQFFCWFKFLYIHNLFSRIKLKSSFKNKISN